MTARTEALLVLRAQSGDLDALGELLMAVQPGLRGYLRVLTRNDGRAEDVLQEAFLLALRRLGTLRDPGLFRPWLYRIAAREAYRRRPAGRGPLDEALEAASPDNHATDLLTAESRTRLREAVLRLPDRGREAVTLHYLHEMPFEQSTQSHHHFRDRGSAGGRGHCRHPPAKDVKGIRMTTQDPVAVALREADRRARWQPRLFWGAVGIEAALIISFLTLADWQNRTHVLLFLSTLGICYALALGVVSLALRLDDCTRRILQSVSLLSRDRNV